mmetsp:Transcript_98378/g.293808  ORF Transcript_98378/g.293808 Transcript_98378/m.293808 type:complete len:233 (-) Transcript_98378:317-1015(-)
MLPEAVNVPGDAGELDQAHLEVPVDQQLGREEQEGPVRLQARRLYRVGRVPPADGGRQLPGPRSRRGGEGLRRDRTGLPHEVPAHPPTWEAPALSCGLRLNERLELRGVPPSHGAFAGEVPDVPAELREEGGVKHLELVGRGGRTQRPAPSLRAEARLAPALHDEEDPPHDGGAIPQQRSDHLLGQPRWMIQLGWPSHPVRGAGQAEQGSELLVRGGQPDRSASMRVSLDDQ